ncbi:hypothetical protein VTI74DRAFT_11516 [Chaetomium olivicolor]
MTTKIKAHALNGIPHTAGIFSDMSIDGPEIGTLVVVVDRAKNLPNRKTIGKQDPYCAARLGKEAKKTNTDIRGGQTPKWDQELRFTVHDSPDYYQLKVSVFNDDKKTELIGEAWIDLRDIVVSGGGQSDQWHQLGCKGKYAGEVRIEITYYDTRPKPEKPAVKAKPPAPAEPEASLAPSGPRTVPKRRPLPSDPVTGKSPAATAPAQAPALEPAPEQVETPPRPQLNPASISHQAQQPEYNQAPREPPQPYYQQPEHHRQDSNREYGTPSRPPPQQYRTPDRPEQYAVQQHDQGYSPQYQQPAYDRHDSFPQANGTRDSEDDRPPPPPAHRSRTGSNTSINAAIQGTMRHDVLRNEAHRNSASANYPGRPTYKAYDSPPAGLAGSQHPQPEQAPPARHYSYDPAYDQHRAMQATVEDVPESPESMNNAARRTSGRWPPQPQSQPQFDPGYEMVASPAPLNVGRSSNEPVRFQGQDQPSHGPNGYHVGSSEIPTRESAQYNPSFGRHSEPSLHSSYETQRALTYRGEPENASSGFSVPPVPPSLVPGIDPGLAQEISERINQDRRQLTQTRRYTAQALIETPPRGRTMDHRYDHDGSPAYNAAPPAHSRSPLTYTNGPSTSSVNVVIKSRAYSPNPPRDPSPNPHHQHTIRRKSVSPRPPVDTNRRLSEIPFGPDSYDALNPTAASAAVKDAAASQPNYREETGKIITHDGREVDPSDHLPMESWAPEPEPKAPSASPAARPSLSGPQPAPPSGRRQLRIAARPQSMLPGTSAISFSGGPDHVESTPSPPASTGRNRLQKKAAYRQSTSAIPPLMSGANGPGPGPSPTVTNGAGFRRSSGGSGMNAKMDPTPLQPIPPHQDNFTPPRGLPRAATFDSVSGSGYGGGIGSENYAPNHSHSPGGMYGSSPGHHNHNQAYSQGYGHSPNRTSGGGNSAPPIPAKVPLALPPPTNSSSPSMNGALQLHSSSVARRAGSGIDDGYHQHDAYGSGGVHGGGGGHGHGRELSLEEELRSIDIGTGRSSRRGAAAQGYGQGYSGGGGGHGYGGQQQGFVYGQGGY